MTAKIAIAVAIVLFLAVFFTFRQADQYKKFMESAEKTNAILLKKEEVIAEPKTKRKERWIVYSYNTSGGHSHTTREFLEYDDIWQNLREGQSVAIYFSKERPSQSHLATAIERRVGLANKLKGAR